MMSISSNDRPFVSGMSLYVRTRGKHHYVSSKKDKRYGCDTHREKVAIAPMLIVANMRKILYPRSVTSVGVTFESTKSAEGACQGVRRMRRGERGDALKSH